MQLSVLQLELGFLVNHTLLLLLSRLNRHPLEERPRLKWYRSEAPFYGQLVRIYHVKLLGLNREIQPVLLEYYRILKQNYFSQQFDKEFGHLLWNRQWIFILSSRSAIFIMIFFNQC